MTLNIKCYDSLKKKKKSKQIENEQNQGDVNLLQLAPVMSLLDLSYIC